MTSDAARDERHRTVQITIDGRPFDVDPDRHRTAGDLLRLAGLNPNGYDLAVVRGHGDVHRFKDTDPVEVHPREKFVSIRQRAEVA
ncbi:hypothetical protein [Parafrankia sp. BMG5.11]|uniref:hypothetical protein n=1 Tax=Parafrankia sp. BMG5.11 TaxID=222540 RepID=UPI00103D9D38|nr:hypothetical protein [Parafrankia sp. BMG5.11]TCJ34614.1 hypothetical protein E0504_31935 [Parafrankia sp. BMG5.11]